MVFFFKYRYYSIYSFSYYSNLQASHKITTRTSTSSSISCVILWPYSYKHCRNLEKRQRTNQVCATLETTTTTYLKRTPSLTHLEPHYLQPSRIILQSCYIWTNQVLLAYSSIRKTKYS